MVQTLVVERVFMISRCRAHNLLIRETSGIRIKGNHSSIRGESKESAHVRSFVITIFENR